MEQLYLPITMGGAGLQRAADRRYIAFFSAHIGALMSMPVQWATINGEHRQSYAEMLEIITECIDNTRAQFIASPAGGNDAEVAQSAKFLEELDRLLVPWVPDDAHTSIQLSSLLRFYSGGERSATDKHHLQTSLTRLARLHQCYAFRHTSSPLISQLSDTFRKGYTAHMNSLNNPLAGWWLTVVPRAQRNEMQDGDYVIAARTRLYVQGHRVKLERCICQLFYEQQGHYLDDPLHALSCKLTRGRQITYRHDKAVESVAHSLRQCGTRVHVEQTSDDPQSKKRPDIFAVISSIPTFIDVGIVQPSAMSHRDKGPLVRTKEYEKEKIAKYKPMAVENDARIIPFIIESNGGYGQQAGYVLEDIKAFAQNEALAFAPSEVVRDLMDSVAIAVQIGNAKAIRSAYERVMHGRYEQHVVSTAQMEQSRIDTDNEDEDESIDGQDEMIQQSSMLQSATTAASMIDCVG